MKTSCIFISVLLTIGGCASPEIISWQKAWEHNFPVEQASAKCEYETSSSTQGVTPGLQTQIGIGLDRQLRKNSLFEKCMNANGWVAARDHMKARLF